MGWNDFTFAMGNISNILRAANTAIKKDDENSSIGTRLQNAGIQLFGNTMALQTARDIRSNTYSSIGYTGFFAANGDASKAMENTTNAAMWAYQTYTPMFYSNCRMRGMSMLNNDFGQQSVYNSTFYNNNNGFRGYWA